MSKKKLTEARAIAAYKAITGTTIYRHAADYMCVTHSCSRTVGYFLLFFLTSE